MAENDMTHEMWSRRTLVSATNIKQWTTGQEIPEYFIHYLYEVTEMTKEETDLQYWAELDYIPEWHLKMFRGAGEDHRFFIGGDDLHAGNLYDLLTFRQYWSANEKNGSPEMFRTSTHRVRWQYSDVIPSGGDFHHYLRF